MNQKTGMEKYQNRIPELNSSLNEGIQEIILKFTS